MDSRSDCNWLLGWNDWMDGCLEWAAWRHWVASEALISQNTGLGRIEDAWLMDSDALSSKVLGWDQRYWAGWDTL